MSARGYELDQAVKDLAEKVRRLDLKFSRHRAIGPGGGDVGGIVPGDVTVTGIRGVPVGTDAATPADRDALIYDATSGAWIADHVQAVDVDYEPTASGLAATDVQAAIDELAGSVGGGMVPYFIAAGETFTVPIYRQALFMMPIDVEGTLDVDGYLLEVD